MRLKPSDQRGGGCKGERGDGRVNGIDGIGRVECRVSTPETCLSTMTAIFSPGFCLLVITKIGVLFDKSRLFRYKYLFMWPLTLF